MTFKDLKKRVSLEATQKHRLYERLGNKSFWIWGIENHKQEDIRNKGNCCFNHIIGLPTKERVEKPIFDYQKILYDALLTSNNYVGLTSVLKEAWNTADNAEDKREKIQALSLAKECYSMKLDLLTNATVVDDAIRFVSEKPKEKLKLPSSAHNGESKEQDYGEKGEEEQEEEKESGEIITTTTNQVF